VRHGLSTSLVFFPVARRAKTRFLLSGNFFETLVFFFMEMKQLPILRYILPFLMLLFRNALCNALVGRVKWALAS